MDVKSMIYNAARDGSLNRLKALLHNKPPEIIRKLISPSITGATPLVTAAKNGHLDVIEYLITHCSADIEEVGNIDFDGEIIEGVPPLWSASAAGHIDVVKVLVKYGAKINSTTKSVSTPLRAACFDGHLEIVKYLIKMGANIEIPNQHGHTCLMISCYKGHYRIVKYLLQCGAEVNRKSFKGNTALHDCAEYGSLEILKLLFEYGGEMVADSYNVTPLLAAAVTGHISIVEYIINMEQCNNEERITALELLGSTYVDNKRDMVGAYQLWKRALIYRSLCKYNAKKDKDYRVIKAYGDMKEFSTLEQLEEIFADPDAMRLQSLIIRERILGPGHPDTTYYIRYRGAVYADSGDYDTCIRLWLYALEKQQEVFQPLSSMTQSSLLSFAELFSFMMSRTLVNINFCDILAVFERTFYEIDVYEKKNKIRQQPQQNTQQHNQQQQQKQIEETSSPQINLKQKYPKADSYNYHRTLDLLLYLVDLLSRTRSLINEDDELKLMRSVHKLVKLDPRNRNSWSLLHLACYNQMTLNLSIETTNVIKLLMDCGADINALNKDLNTPLHVTVLKDPCRKDIIKLLLDYGAHLDMRNEQRLTPLELDSNAFTEICPLKHTNLQCLCAHQIVKHNIKYKGIVTDYLEKFIQKH